MHIDIEIHRGQDLDIDHHFDKADGRTMRPLQDKRYIVETNLKLRLSTKEREHGKMYNAMRKQQKGERSNFFEVPTQLQENL